MCGFLAIYGEMRDKINDDEVRKLLYHRGPDDFQVYKDEKVSLYFSRLAIIDPKGPGQPSVSQCGRFISLFNGEIYNYKNLQTHLRERGISLKSKGDAEVLPNLFSLYGEDFLDYLEGMFSIVIWDKEESRLNFFRDRTGIKPLYYTETDNGFACGSEIKPLRLLNEDSLGLESIERESVEDYLAFGYLPFESTIFKNIKKLPAGYKGQYGKSFEIKKYWEPSLNNSFDINDVEDLLRKITQEHLVSDVPVGVFLSGGFDSSLIAALAAEKCPSMNAYTVKFSDGGLDESVAASEVAKRYGLKHHIFETSVEELVDLLPAIFWASDEPNSDSGIMPSYYISKRAKQSGSVVVLAGTGGDEIFGGYNYYVKNEWERRLSFLGPLSILAPKKLRKNGIISKVIRSLSFSKRPMLNFFYHRCLFGDEFVHDIGKRVSRFEQIGREFFHFDGQKRRMWCDLKTYLPEELLSLLDRVTMGNSIEGRVPFCDHRLVEALYRIDTSSVFFNEDRKGLMKKISKKFLPQAIFNLPKSGFNSPVNNWVENHEVQERIKSSLFGKSSHVRNILGNRLTEKRFKDMNFYQKWALFSLEVFLKVHIVESRDEIVNPPKDKLWELVG